LSEEDWMDAVDQAILRRLQRDGRQTNRELAETLGVFVVTGNEDVLVHVAVPSTQYLRDFVLDRLARRKEFVDVRTTVVFEYVQPAEQSELPDGRPR
jgi:DNA-binding Lrp family transcriptional regulator